MATIYVVFDFETSGINPLTNRVLEIGALHINMQTLEVLGRFQAVAGIPQVALDALNMDDFVLNMHTENGLFAEVVAKEPEGAFELDLKLAKWFEEIGAGPRDIILCGNSIHFDRGFMECWMIQSFKFLSHRVVDTSSILTCYKEWVSDKRHTAAHRAIADCEASLEVLKWAKPIFQAAGGSVTGTMAVNFADVFPTKESESQP
jgi:oligoribonuclease